MPLTCTVDGTVTLVSRPMPFSIAAATVKILKVEPAPSPTWAKGSGWTVCRLPTSRP